MLDVLFGFTTVFRPLMCPYRDLRGNRWVVCMAPGFFQAVPVTTAMEYDADRSEVVCTARSLQALVGLVERTSHETSTDTLEAWFSRQSKK